MSETKLSSTLLKYSIFTVVVLLLQLVLIICTYKILKEDIQDKCVRKDQFKLFLNKALLDNVWMKNKILQPAAHTRFRRNVRLINLFAQLNSLPEGIDPNTYRPIQQPGPPGPPGPLGPPGYSGPCGIPGEKGEPGIEGVPGQNGEKGEPGLESEKGDRGAEGLPGVPGQNGEKGDRGAEGLPGVPGQNGKKGEPGIEGEKGDRGAEGLPGVSGQNGKKGEPGIEGEKGDRGAEGQPGVPGQNGEKGEPGIEGVPGQNGEKGNRGAEGLPGVPGQNGEKGDRGAEGLPGVPGQDGKKGDRGAEGLPGFPGLRGEKGDRGAEGTRGFLGQNGEKGDRGAEGLPGFPGLRGDKGDQGFPGPKDSVLLGSTGESGIIRQTAPRGLPGPKGDKGESGQCYIRDGNLIKKYIEIKPYGKKQYQGVYINGTDRIIASIGIPRNYGSLFNNGDSWILDSNPLNEADAKKIWVTSNDYQLLEFKNNESLQELVSLRTYDLDVSFDGNANVIYKGAFYYKTLRNKPKIIKYDFKNENTKDLTLKELESTNMVKLYQSNISHFDFSVDENGLWVISTTSNSNNIGFAKIDDKNMTIQHMWELSLKSKDLIDMFVASGILYTVENTSTGIAVIGKGINLVSHEVLTVNIDIPDVNGITMATYNMEHKLLLLTSNNNRLAYPIFWNDNTELIGAVTAE